MTVRIECGGAPPVKKIRLLHSTVSLDHDAGYRKLYNLHDLMHRPFMSHDRAVEQLSGAYSAIFTPFDADHHVNFDMLSQLVEFQLAAGLGGFFVAGSTGEGLLLSEQERMAVVRHVVDCCAGRGTVIAHVGHPSTDVASRLAKQAASDGADWIAAVGPIYHGTTFEGMLRHYGQISSATELPFMVYALGSEIRWQRDRQLFDLPNVCGLKYTGANFYSVQQLARRLDKPVALMSGFDEQFVAALCLGFHGGIGSTYNFGPQFYAGIYKNFRADNTAEAARLQAEINCVTDYMVQQENWSYRKAIMRYIGLDCGPCRAPYAPLAESEYASWAEGLDQLGILQRGDTTSTP